MREIAESVAHPAQAPWTGEERLVREAVPMVSSNESPRVLVAGLAVGERILDRCKRATLEAGCRVVSKPAHGSDRLDLVVEAIR